VKTPENCPNCGADVPARAKACPECGADEQTGWSEEATGFENIGIPEESFNYDDYVNREFGGEASPAENRQRFWKKTGVVVLILFLLPVVYIVIRALLDGSSR
jgi:hypothetical protein